MQLPGESANQARKRTWSEAKRIWASEDCDHQEHMVIYDYMADSHAHSFNIVLCCKSSVSRTDKDFHTQTQTVQYCSDDGFRS